MKQMKQFVGMTSDQEVITKKIEFLEAKLLETTNPENRDAINNTIKLFYIDLIDTLIMELEQLS